MKPELFRNLSEAEEEEFRQWARDNFKAGDTINGVWHPVVQDECRKMVDIGQNRLDRFMDDPDDMLIDSDDHTHEEQFENSYIEEGLE